MRLSWSIVMLAVLLLAMGCRSSQATSKDGPCDLGVKPLPERVQRGISLAHNYQHKGSRGYGSATSDRTLAELSDLGAQWVSLTPFGFMRSLDEPVVHFIGDYPGGETDERMERVIAQAKARGLQVLLKPHLWIARGDWRGEIGFEEDSDWQRWFDSYERWILHYADMAQRLGVDTLVVGVEFRSSQKSHEDLWRALVGEVRKRFQGKLTYSANWDDAAELPWWDALDYIGVQFYPPLASGLEARPPKLESALASQLGALEGLSKRYDKPVLFTEVGYRAAEDGLQHPHEWPERSYAKSANPKTQELGYRAFFDAIRARPWVRGVYWWKWFTDPNTDEEGPAGFSPRGKPAERVLRAAYGGSCRAP
jgi:hypothetical protein